MRRWFDPILDFFFVSIIFLVCLWTLWISCEPVNKDYSLPQNVKPNMDSEK